MIDNLKTKLIQARKEKNKIKLNILSLILGEISTLDARGQNVDDGKINNIIKKIIISNKETLTHKESDVLVQENIILENLLPSYWNQSQINDFFNNGPEVEMIKNAKTEGQAIGIAIKSLKIANAPVETKEITSFVKNLRINVL